MKNGSRVNEPEEAAVVVTHEPVRVKDFWEFEFCAFWEGFGGERRHVQPVREVVFHVVPFVFNKNVA